MKKNPQQKSIASFFGPKDTEEKKRKRIVESESDDSQSPRKENKNVTKSVKKPAAAVASTSKAAPKIDSNATSSQKPSGAPLAFADLCKLFEEVESTTKRLIILEATSKFLLRTMKQCPSDLLAVVYLCINKLAPTWDGIELGVGESLLIKAIAESTGRTTQKIKADLQTRGDLGSVAQSSRGNQMQVFKPKPLTVRGTFKVLKEIATISGNSSMQRKVDKIRTLLVACKDTEAKYLIRALEGKLRIGLAEQTVLSALAQASFAFHEGVETISECNGSDLQKSIETLKQVYNELPTYEIVVPYLLEHGFQNILENCKMTPGIPLKPMLAHPTKAISDVLNRFENIPFTCEYKYDGERAQIHKLENGEIKIFSRNQEHMSEKYPDIVECMKSIPKEGVKSFVLDTEAVAWDVVNKEILPFQVLSTRKRKDVNASDIKVQVCVFAFDLLYLNGEPLLRHTLKERRRILAEHFNVVEGKFKPAKHMDSKTIEDIQTFLDEAVNGNCEGLMVKTVEAESSYEPSKRSRNWLKLKKDYLDGVGDSLDLVVIGGYIGKGKRTGGYGGFLLACYDKDREEYQAICKIGTGFSDEDLATHGSFFKQHEMTAPKSYYAYGEGVKPDVWFEPCQVWEVKTADLSISPVYQAAVGIVDPNKGISLRFPRFIRIRDDKSVEEATTSEQVATMYKNQKINSGFGNADDEDEF